MLILANAGSNAQVVRDGSVGPRNPPNPPRGPHYLIPANLGEKDASGNNLFHSFSQFDLQTGDSAAFTGEGARNILARVTGGAESSINGRISADTNLFLMNRAGITFHENASIDVKGSFFATTADYIRLGNDGKFGATLSPADKVLTSSDPSAFGFMTPTPAAIRVLGKSFTGPDLKTLGLIGGNVSVEKGVTIQAEDVQIVSVRSTGEAALQLPNATNGLRYPSINAENFSQHGAISVGEPTVPGKDLPPKTSIAASRVVIRGGTFVMKNADITTTATNPGDGVFMRITDALSLSDRSTIQSINVGDFRGLTTVDISAGTVTAGVASQINTLTADPGSGGDLRLMVNGALQLSESSSITTESASSIRGGDVFISSASISLQNASISSQGDLPAKSGDIHLEVSGALTLTDQGSVNVSLQQASNEQIFVSAGEIFVSGIGSGFRFQDLSPDGLGGSVNLTSRGQLSILNGGIVSATTYGRNGAAIGITAGNVLISSQSVSDHPTGITAENTGGPGTHGGAITLAVAGSLDVLDGGTISTNTIGQGSGGDIEIAARDVTVTGRAGMVTQDAFLQHGISAQNIGTDPAIVPGDSGSVRLNLSGKLAVRDFGEIVVDTSSSGRGGNVDINAHDVSVSTQGIIAARTFSPQNGGNGGDLTLNASGRLEVAAGGQISVGTFGSGAGGAISISGNEVSVNGRDAHISAVSGSPLIPATGSGGNLRFDVRSLQVSDDGQVTASTYGSGAGGSIEIAADRISIADGNRTNLAGISAQTLSTGAGGPGGTVQIDTQTIEMRGPGAAITTQSLGVGSSGRIRIAADTISMSDGSTIQSSGISTGKAGSIAINAKGEITLSGGSSLSVASAQSDAGDIQVRSGGSIDLTDSSITAQAAINGGSIDLRARDLLFLTNSQITAAAGLNGGNIFIDPHFVLLNTSSISANAIRGRGGNVRIISDFFLAPPGSSVTATSELGIDGTVQIDALDGNLTGSLVELPSTLLNAESLLRDLCTVKIDKFSSFISEGRGGLPPLPGEAVPSLMIVR